MPKKAKRSFIFLLQHKIAEEIDCDYISTFNTNRFSDQGFMRLGGKKIFQRRLSDLDFEGKEFFKDVKTTEYVCGMAYNVKKKKENLKILKK